jgi:hypothetical protein
VETECHYEPAYEVQRNGAQEGSLFSSDEKTLSDADIARVLEYKYVAPPRSRIAILPFGWGAWSGWPEQMAIATDTIDKQVISVLRSSRGALTVTPNHALQQLPVVPVSPKDP